MSASEASGLIEELEVLEAIYIHELQVVKNESHEVSSIILQLKPATGDDTDQQYVCMTLQLDPPPTYPDEPPEILIKNPRGIGEEEVQSLLEALHDLCAERVGGPMLYELIELAKESLTADNIPHCLCMICLDHFHEGEAFTRTDCYHYFHEQCLARYVKHCLALPNDVTEKPSLYAKVEQKKQIVCPVCREEIASDQDWLSVHTPIDEKVVFEFSEELRALQARMAALFEKQRANGSIIDVEAEKNKYLIQEADSVYLPNEQSVAGACDKTDMGTRSSKQGHRGTSPENTRNRDRNRYRRDKDYSQNYQRDRRNYKVHDRGGGARMNEYSCSDGEVKTRRDRRFDRNADRSRDRPRSGVDGRQGTDNNTLDRSSKHENKNRTGMEVDDAVGSIYDVKENDDDTGSGKKESSKAELEVNSGSEIGEKEEQRRGEKNERERNDCDDNKLNSRGSSRFSDTVGLEGERSKSHSEENSNRKTGHNTERPQSSVGRGRNRDNNRYNTSSGSEKSNFDRRKENNDSTSDRSTVRPKSGLGRHGRGRDLDNYRPGSGGRTIGKDRDINKDEHTLINNRKETTASSEVTAEVSNDKEDDKTETRDKRNIDNRHLDRKITDRSHTSNSRSGYRDDQHGRKADNYERNNYDRQKNYRKESDRMNWRDSGAKVGAKSNCADDDRTFDPYYNDDYEEEPSHTRKESHYPKLGHGRGRARPRGKHKDHYSDNFSLSDRSREMSGSQRAQKSTASHISDKDCDRYVDADAQLPNTSNTEKRNNQDKNKTENGASAEKMEVSGRTNRSENVATVIESVESKNDNVGRGGPPGFKLKPPPGMGGSSRTEEKIVSPPPGFS